jgi:putative two-component system response regulator
MNIMKQVHLSEDELAALGQHHERMDGLGYPNGLKGEAISLVARIVAVADVFDALTSARPYRPAMSVAVALDILEKEAGNHLDPKSVDAFFRAQVKGEIVV